MGLRHRTADPRRAVPSGVDPDAGGKTSDAELPGALRALPDRANRVPITAARGFESLKMIRYLLSLWRRFEQMLTRIQPWQARRLVISMVGFTLLLLGVAMMVLPGPAFVVIPAGLAVLALEFAWARSLLEHARRYANKMTGRGSPPPEGTQEPVPQRAPLGR